MSFLRCFFPKALWRMDRQEHAVYLTFDDGPIPQSTPFILETLKAFGAKGTFFVIGENAERYPDLTRAILADGHRLGNHTHNHLKPFACSAQDYLANVGQADLKQPQTSQPPLFRPPHGWMSPAVYRALRKTHQIVMWDVLTRDYSRYVTADDVVNTVKRYTRNGSIITFHDSLKSIEKLRTALPAALQWMKEEGYEFRLL